LAAPPPTVAGAFLLAEGEAKVFVSALLTTGNGYFDRKGRSRARGPYRKQDLQIFAEYGLTQRVTVVASTALQRIDARDEERSRRSGLGRSEIGARARIVQTGPWIAALQASAIIAGAKRKEGYAAVGETDHQIDVRGLVARSFELFGRPAFWDLQAGYRMRGGDPADEIRLDLSLGIRPSPRWLVMAQSFNTIGLGGWAGPHPLRQRIHKVQGAAFFDLTQSLTLYGAAFATPLGRDALDERGAVVGLGYRF
jgi:hypothetical protein